MQYVEIFKQINDNQIKKVFNGFIEDNENYIHKFCGEEQNLPTTFQGPSLDIDELIIKKNEQFYQVTDDGELTLYSSAEGMEQLQMDGVKVYAMFPGLEGFYTFLVDALKPLQTAVSDHREPSLIEYSFPWPENVLVLGNEEAKLINLPFNRELRACGEIYCGPIFILQEDSKGNFVDISEELVERLLPDIRILDTEKIPERYNDFLMFFE